MPTALFQLPFGLPIAVSAHDDELDALRAIWDLYEVHSAEHSLSVSLTEAGELWVGEHCKLRGLRGVDRLFAVELLLLKYTREQSPRGGWIHAAALVRGATLVMIAGDGGLGKTSITLELLAHGNQYLTDDSLWTDSVTWAGIARHLQFKPMLAKSPVPDRLANTDCLRRRYLSNGHAWTTPIHRVMPSQHVAWVQHPEVVCVVLSGNGEPDRLSPLPGFDGVAALIPHTNGCATLPASTRYYQLRARSFRANAAAIAELQGSGSQP